MQSRRKFLINTSKAALGTSALAFVAVPRPFRRLGATPRLDYSTFARLVQTRFRAFDAAAASADLLLLQAEALPATAGGECFSLMFLGRPDQEVDQGTYRFEHPVLGEFQMFVVPKPGVGHGQYIEAIFNRI